MADEVIVETNWILDVTLHEDAASETLFEYAVAEHLPLLLQSFCIAEAIKAVETKRSGWRSLGDRLGETRADIVRSRTLSPLAAEPLERAQAALVQTSDMAVKEFWEILEKIVRMVRPIAVSPQNIQLTAQLQDMFNLQLADSAVLATVTEARRTGLCSKFMSRDAAFGSPGPLSWLEREGIEYLRSAEPIVGPIRQRLLREDQP